MRTYLNLFIVFFLTGLWHGADVSFILWGLYHGLFSIIERLGLKKVLDKSKIFSRVYCFLIVNFGWVLFRAGNTSLGLSYISRMFHPFEKIENAVQSWKYMDQKTIFAGICAVLGMGFLQVLIPEKLAKRWKNSVVEALYCIVLLILCLAAVASDTYNPFIYFQF